MDFKRIISAILGLPLVLVILIFANKYIVDICLAIVAFLSMYEYFNAISKKVNPVKWLGYLSCLSIALIHIIPSEYLSVFFILAIPTVLLILFLQVIITQMRTNFKDVIYTFFGICYIVFFLIFLALIRGIDDGKILVWYVIFAAWGTDIFAYCTGKLIGKHKFSNVSPKKSIEGCIGGIVGAVVVALIYTYFMNQFAMTDYSYIMVLIATIVLSIIGQVGDLAASSIKRYVNIKDYSELIPGHGGMLDRIDSLLFITPFAYILFLFI